MTKVLLLTRGFGPAQAQVYSSLRSAGHVVEILDVNGHWLRGGAEIPLWMRGYRLRRSPLATGYMMQFIESRKVDQVIAMGLEPGAFAGENIARPFIPWLLRGSLDFSAARIGMGTDFSVLNSSAGRLLLDDEWEMDKASAKGSTVPHLRTPQLLGSGHAVLSRDAQPKVALLHPHDMAVERLEIYRETLAAVLGRTPVVPVQVESLYRARDLGRDRRLEPTARARLEGYTHAVLLGTSPHYGAVLGTLAGDWPRIAVEQTIGSGNLAGDLGLKNSARGLKLATVVREMVSGEVETAPGVTRHPRLTHDGEDVLDVLNELMAISVPPGYEELAAMKSSGPLNVFYSVAGLQDRTNGARPQRIRNMAEAMDEQQPALRIFSSDNGFSRRARALQAMLEKGRPAGLFYGENSTSPIASERAVDQLQRLMDDFRAAGGRSAWFVRDFHWLDTIDGYLDEDALRDEVTRRGLKELRQIGDRADVLLAPCAESGEGFNRLLTEHGESAREWKPMPPAVAAANVMDAASLDPAEDGTTLLYAGGLNSVYGMDLYLTAIRDQVDEFLLDFVVREDDVPFLHSLLERHGLADASDRVRIQTMPLDLYRPRTTTCLGMILLDSEYARFSFPYKTVSMIERGFPILCYDDMAIADFVCRLSVGVACARTPEGIRQGIERLTAARAPGLAEARHTQTWNARVNELRTMPAANAPI